MKWEIAATRPTIAGGKFLYAPIVQDTILSPITMIGLKIVKEIRQ